MGARLFFILLFFSPLLFSFENDKLREETLIAVALVAIFFFLCLRKKHQIYNLKEIIIISLFSLVVIIQQLFIVNGSLVFGFKYAIVFLSSFIPYWLARSLRNCYLIFNQTVVIAIWILFLITIGVIFSSYLFGWGEVYSRADGYRRAFGWLGDSFTPVIVFLVFYCFFSKNTLALGVSLIALLMTGGKAAIIMLIISPIVFVFIASSARKKIMFAVFYFATLVLLILYAGPIVEKWKSSSLFDYTYNTRIISVSLGLEYFINNPIIGSGINQSMKLIQTDAIMFANWMSMKFYFPVYQIHNTVVRTAAETGVVGLSLLFSFLYISLSSAFRMIRVGRKMTNLRERAVILSLNLWIISFILFHQTTGWFEAGHPQLSWLLMFITISEVFYNRLAIDKEAESAE